MLLKAAAAMAMSVVCAIAQPAATDAGQRLYRTHCFVCHGEDGTQVSGVNFRSGRFRRASSDDDLARLILTGIPGTGMPPTNLAEDQRKAIVAYIRSMSGPGVAAPTGDAALGKSIFEGKGGCLACHRVGTNGSHLGPDLSDIGSRLPAAQIERSILDSNRSIEPRNRFVRAVTRDGVVITGRRLNEDTHTIQLIDGQERLVSLQKSDLRELTLLKTSTMPSYADKFSSAEIVGLVSYLASLRGSQ